MPGPHKPRAFSMLELVIVIAILGIVAAIAVPRLSRASQGAADNALRSDLRVLRSALELYRAEHDGALPPGQHIAVALMAYSNRANTLFSVTESQALKTIYGPYLKFPAPSLPVGRRKGADGISSGTEDTVAWVYDESAGTIRANTDADEKDASGTLYSAY